MLLVGVGGEEIDVGEVGGIAFAEEGDQFAQTGESARARFIGDVIAFQSRMTFHALDKLLKLGALRIVLEGFGIKQFAGEDRTEMMPGRRIEPFGRRRSQVEPFGGHCGQCIIRGGRRTPKGDDEVLLFPTLGRLRSPTAPAETPTGQQNGENVLAFVHGVFHWAVLALAYRNNFTFPATGKTRLDSVRDFGRHSLPRDYGSFRWLALRA